MRRQAGCVMRMKRVLSACLVVVFVLCAFGSVALAQEKAKLDEQATKQMLGYIREANEFFDKAQWQSALELYKKAYALSPQPALLYRMGKCAEGAGKTREAIDYYSQFVEALPEKTVAKEVAAYLPQLKATLPPELKITSEPSNANVYVGSLESAPVGSTPYEGKLETGEVNVIVRLDGYKTFSKTYTFEGAGQETLNVTLEPKKEATEPLKPIVDNGEDKGTGSSGGKLKKIGYGVTGAGILLLAGGGAMTALQMRATDQVNSFDKNSSADPDGGRAELQGLKDDANGYWRNSMILYSAGGIVTVAGVGMVVMGMMKSGDSDQASSQALQLNFAVTPQGGSVGVFGSF